MRLGGGSASAPSTDSSWIMGIIKTWMPPFDHYREIRLFYSFTLIHNCLVQVYRNLRKLSNRNHKRKWTRPNPCTCAHHHTISQVLSTVHRCGWLISKSLHPAGNSPNAFSNMLPTEKRWKKEQPRSLFFSKIKFSIGEVLSFPSTPGRISYRLSERASRWFGKMKIDERVIGFSTPSNIHL